MNRGDTNIKKSNFNIRDNDINKDTLGKASPPKKLFEKSYIYRIGVPIKLNEKSVSLTLSKKSLLDKYYKLYNID